MYTNIKERLVIVVSGPYDNSIDDETSNARTEEFHNEEVLIAIDDSKRYFKCVGNNDAIDYQDILPKFSHFIDINGEPIFIGDTLVNNKGVEVTVVRGNNYACGRLVTGKFVADDKMPSADLLISLDHGNGFRISKHADLPIKK